MEKNQFPVSLETLDILWTWLETFNRSNPTGKDLLSTTKVLGALVETLYDLRYKNRNHHNPLLSTEILTKMVGRVLTLYERCMK